MLSIFVSYSREQQDTVKTLVQDLESIGHKIWFDQQLTGGQLWWDEILTRIRECDLFIFALARESLASNACKLEYTYASDLNKNILPVLIAEGVSYNLLPASLSKVQFIDYRSQDKKAALALLKAVEHLPPAKAAPTILPTAPEVPISYLGDLREQIETNNNLSFEAQSALLIKLKERLKNPEEAKDVYYLLSSMRNRDDLLARVASEIDELQQHAEKLAPSPSVKNVFQKTTVKPMDLRDSDLQLGQPVQETDPSGVSSLLGSKSIVYAGHTIEVRTQDLLGRERVFYDGREVSSKLTMFRPTHIFSVVENKEQVDYEVVTRARMITLGMSAWVEVKRNGKVIYSNR